MRIHLHNSMKIKVDNKSQKTTSNYLTFTILSQLYYIKRKQNRNYGEHLIKIETYRNQLKSQEEKIYSNKCFYY